jgi:hypothetical protein
MKLSIRVLTFLFVILSHQEILAEEYADQIVKINDQFYTGKIKGRNLWLVMEHVTDPFVHGAWKHYANIQSKNRVVQWALRFNRNFTSDGSRHFKMVLDEVSITSNEVWIAYVTTNPSPVPMQAASFYGYNEDHLDIKKAPHTVAKDIVMFVTITSSPTAIITSHMGVSTSIEGLQNRQPQISMDLHSFAAKVMRIRNPHRILMVNAPVIGMEKIIASSVSEDAFFAGTREMRATLEQRQRASLEDFLADHPQWLSQEKQRIFDRMRRMETSLTQRLKFLEEDFAEQYLSKEDYEKDRADFTSKLENAKAILSGDEQRLNAEIQKELLPLFYTWQNPYPFEKWPGIKSLSHFLSKYPPILSVDGKDGRQLDKRMIIYDGKQPDKVVLTINKGDKDYDWIFTEPFKAEGDTHYIAVDLEALAQAKSLE